MKEHDATSTPILLKKRLKYAGDIYAILVTRYGWTNEAAIELLDKCPAVVECETELALNARFELEHRMGYKEGYDTGYEAGYQTAKDEIVRCKDCVYLSECFMPMCYCEVWKTIHGMGKDGFCGYGKRKEDVK